MEEAFWPRAVPADERLAWADDAELVSACAAGAAGAFRELLARYRKSAFALAYQMLGNRDDAEDIAQEAFVRVFQAIASFRREASFSTWLFRIVTNLCLGRIRQDHHDVELEAVREPRAAQNPCRSVTEGLLTRQVLAAMAPDLRAVLLLREQEGLSYKDISQALGVPLGTVRSRLSKARAAFRAIWRELSEEREDVRELPTR